MTGRGLQTWAAMLAMVVVVVLSTGLPGALHSHSAHGHTTETRSSEHSHTCAKTADHHGHPHPSRENDHNHSEGSCELCLMLATGGKWGIQFTQYAITAFDFATIVELQPSRVVDSLPMPALLARGPPTPICAG